ncbi:MAG: PAS domain-containing sensor histidine kinase [Chloroflexi bacterium]|nr:MAG: PAS domain-containing sensor histidine kinase [Chloroflexota bacterium]
MGQRLGDDRAGRHRRGRRSVHRRGQLRAGGVAQLRSRPGRVVPVLRLGAELGARRGRLVLVRGFSGTERAVPVSRRRRLPAGDPAGDRRRLCLHLSPSPPGHARRGGPGRRDRGVVPSVRGLLVLALRRARRGDVGRMALLLGGLASVALSDSMFAYLTANGTYGAIGSVLDAGWVVGYLLIALAPLWPARRVTEETQEGPIELWQLALPWVATLVAAVTAVRLALVDQNLDRFATVLAGGIGLLFVANQVLSHRDSLDLLHKSRRAENQLGRRNSLLDEIISHAPLGIAHVGPDMNIVDVNPRMAALLRIGAQEMVGTPVARFLHPDEFSRVFQIFQPLWRGDVDTVESDSRAIRADNTEVWLHWSATGVRNAAGRIDYFLAMYEDTDAEHAANESAAAHLAGLERLNRLKSEFVSLVSHEFRTALVGISGFSEMIRDEDVSLEEAKGYAADINKDADRLNRMINDILDLDRIEAGRLVLQPQAVDINNLLDDAVDRARASSARHSIVCSFDPAKPVVQCDPDRIAQVMANLLSNAIKYSPEGGEITVSSVAREGHVDVSVRDHGIGIAPDFAQRLFSRYERYEKTTSKIMGTGLGLAITRQIVEMHGGRIWVDSEPGAGADFRFTLPVQADYVDNCAEMARDLRQ